MAIVTDAMRYLEKDTILYRSESEDLSLAQKEAWDPIIKWAKENFGLLVEPTFSIQEGDTKRSFFYVLSHMMFCFE